MRHEQANAGFPGFFPSVDVKTLHLRWTLLPDSSFIAAAGCIAITGNVKGRT